jgi:molecular chaperone DnaK
MAADNKILGQFDLVGLPPAPRGVPQIEVTFDIDANGIVNVSAKDKATGKEQQIRIQASGGLSQADIDRMVKEAESHAAEDRQRRELIEARNQADTAIYTAEKELKELATGVGDEERKAVEQAIAALREAISGEDLGRLRERIDALSQALTRLADVARRAAASAGQGQEADRAAAGNKPSGAGTEGVVDAEFEEVDDQKKQGSG